ncbi:biotin transport system substrate-specific component [Microbacterium keratanolyticum]|uniref:Biotin transporter n=1 Tax=Microbacterium keratanolyticum TaxID=67574 RepID=A0A9W6HTY0_9MICO|nr:biotin transporter BioY [Microbacterium keratanolyticum]MBM7467870.1 biotin transport system substrate-specific component [Microbacterium keratanolyticum]GLK02861.1 biotin biosynthesis protein BioY [Microbacterium keratanolyticum]
MTAVSLESPRHYLADAWGGAWARDVALVLAGTALITLSAFAIVPLPFTPVPITLATLGVMATGAALGPARGAASALLYLAIGALGAPVFAGGASGVLLPTFGYIVGYVVAAFIVGQLARRRADRRVLTTLALGAIGTLSLYLCGVPWLAFSLQIDLGQAVLLGVVPFLIGDALKVLALSGMLPAAWRLVARVEGRRR